jgi:hypothetical protein
MNEITLDDQINTVMPGDDAGCAAYTANVRHHRTLKIGATALLAAVIALAFANVVQATRPPKVLVVRIDEAGRAEAIRINTTNYIPQAPEIRAALFTWTLQRYRIVRSIAKDDFRLNYYLLSGALHAKLHDADMATVAGVVSGADPEQDVVIKRIGIAPITVTKRGLDSVGAGSAQIEIALRKGLDEPDSPDAEKQRWLLDFRYIVNPAEAARRAEVDPNFQIYNPLGITITSFFATRELGDEAKTK